MYFKYDIKKTEEIMQHFYNVTKIKTVLHNSDFSTITAIPFEECSFCNEMSSVPEAKIKCNDCTKKSLELCRNKNETIIYHCHVGLIEAVSPVRIKDVIVGYIMFGQVLQENADKKEITNRSVPYIGESASVFLDELTPHSDEEIYSAAKLMESCICYLLMNNFINHENGNLIFELSKYIEDNPSADLSVDGLCERFNISRNHLYKLSNNHFGMPIATYVRNKRLNYAKDLIKKGYSVTTAAERAGFYDYGYFGKIFKQHIGKTPSQIKTST